MAIWPFNRNKEQSADLPQEVQDYYQSEKRQRAGVAGLLAVGTLVVTVLLALGLFFGGRWVYRSVFDKDKGSDSNTTQTETTTQPTEQPAPASDPVPTPAPETSAPQPTTLPSDGESTTAVTPSRQAGSDMPDTGPGDVAAVFIGTVLAAATIHYLATRRSLVKSL